mgnify:CR=1 FL=1
MHIGIIVKRNDELSLKLYDEDLRILEDESFSDVFSLNFFLQTLPRKYQISKTLLIVHNQRLNRVDMQIATNENSYYITWYIIILQKVYIRPAQITGDTNLPSQALPKDKW